MHYAENRDDLFRNMAFPPSLISLRVAAKSLICAMCVSLSFLSVTLTTVLIRK